MTDASPPATPSVPPTPDDEGRAGTELASPLQRLGARVLDTGIVTLANAFLFSVLVRALDSVHVSLSQQGPVLFFLMFPVLHFVYEGAFLVRDGQTPGKKAVAIRVASYTDGSPPGRGGWLRAAVYALPGVLPCAGCLFWCVDALTCVWDRPYRQCLHDKSARTVVVTA